MPIPQGGFQQNPYSSPGGGQPGSYAALPFGGQPGGGQPSGGAGTNAGPSAADQEFFAGFNQFLQGSGLEGNNFTATLDSIDGIDAALSQAKPATVGDFANLVRKDPNLGSATSTGGGSLAGGGGAPGGGGVMA